MKRHAPATLRNRDAIADVLASELPVTGTVLEVASGSGEHVIYFAKKFPALAWQPSDHDRAALESIKTWCDEEGLANTLPPLEIDASADWSNAGCNAILCCNMIHISPWAAAEGLFRNAGALLPKDGALILYGPFIENDVPTAQSNLDFDQSLRLRDPQWGIRSVTDVDLLAQVSGLRRTARHEMPANNLMLIYRK